MFTDEQSYRPGYNPQFVANVLRKRELERQERLKLEARLARRAAEREERAKAAAKIRAENEFKEIVVRELPSSGLKVIKDLITLVANEHGLTYADILGDSRCRPVIRARHEAMRVVADARPDMSIASMARFFKRDHTTLIFALKKTRKPGASR